MFTVPVTPPLTKSVSPVKVIAVVPETVTRPVTVNLLERVLVVEVPDVVNAFGQVFPLEAIVPVADIDNPEDPEIPIPD